MKKDTFNCAYAQMYAVAFKLQSEPFLCRHTDCVHPLSSERGCNILFLFTFLYCFYSKKDLDVHVYHAISHESFPLSLDLTPEYIQVYPAPSLSMHTFTLHPSVHLMHDWLTVLQADMDPGHLLTLRPVSVYYYTCSVWSLFFIIAALPWHNSYCHCMAKNDASAGM